MTVEELISRWPGLAPVAPRVPTTEELLARDDATAAAIRAYLSATSAVPHRGEVVL